jgi:hypothetical protein
MVVAATAAGASCVAKSVAQYEPNLSSILLRGTSHPLEEPVAAGNLSPLLRHPCWRVSCMLQLMLRIIE